MERITVGDDFGDSFDRDGETWRQITVMTIEDLLSSKKKTIKQTLRDDPEVWYYLLQRDFGINYRGSPNLARNFYKEYYRLKYEENILEKFMTNLSILVQNFSQYTLFCLQSSHLTFEFLYRNVAYIDLGWYNCPYRQSFSQELPPVVQDTDDLSQNITISDIIGEENSIPQISIFNKHFSSLISSIQDLLSEFVEIPVTIYIIYDETWPEYSNYPGILLYFPPSFQIDLSPPFLYSLGYIMATNPGYYPSSDKNNIEKQFHGRIFSILSN